jgi:hypothetical protein
VAVVDWQWCGGGLGAMDVAYLLNTSAQGQVLLDEPSVLRVYHSAVVEALQQLGTPCHSFSASLTACPSLRELGLAAVACVV